MKAETAGTEPERRLQIPGKTRCALMEILGAEPEMLVQNALESAVDHRSHDPLDRIPAWQR